MRKKITDALRSFVPLQLTLVVATIILRLYEWSVTPNSSTPLSSALWYDVAFSFFAGGAFLLIYTIIAVLHLRTAVILSVVLMAFVVIAEFILIRDF